MFHWLAPHFSVDAVQQFGPNIVGFQLATEERRWYIVGCYLAPDDTSTIESVVAALKERPRGAKLLVVGYFNVNLAEPEGGRREAGGERISQRPWQRRDWNICRSTSSRDGVHGAGTGGRGD